jgi:hypothetical protein
MTPSAHDLAAVVARLERVEQQNRRLKGYGAAICLVGVISLLLGAQAEQKGKLVEADKFVLRDSFGRQRVILSMTRDDESAPALVFYDENLRPRAALGVSKDGPGLYFTDASGKHRAVLSRNSDGIGFDLLDADGKPRAAFHVNDSMAGFLVKDEEGKTRLAVGMDKDVPSLYLYDAAGKMRAALGVDKKGSGFRLLDAKEKVLFGKP